MSKKYGNEDREIRNLRQKLKCYKDNGNIDGQSEILVQLGDEYRQMVKNDEALECYNDAVKLAQKISKFENLAHCHRNIASILSEENDEAARKHVQLFLTYARKMGSHNMIQLALHEYAFIYQGYATLNKWYLLEAFEKALQCKQYLTKHAGDIDNDKEAVKTAENSKRRMAGINSLLAEIFQCFGDYPAALRYNNMAVEYAQSTKDYGLLYSCLLMKIELTNGEKKVALAKQRMEVAHQHLKQNINEADLEYSKQILNFFPSNFDDLAPVLKILFKLRKNSKVSSVCKEYLCFIWKYDKRIAALSKNLDDTSKYKICERIADSAVNIKLFELALRFYERMLGYSTNIRYKEKALVSIAETLIDLGDFRKASEYYEKCLELIRKYFGKDKTKLTETEISLAVTRSKDVSLPVDVRFKSLKKCFDLDLNSDMENVVLEAIVMLLNVNRQQYKNQEIDKWTNAWKEKRERLENGQDPQNEEVEDGEEDEEDEEVFGDVTEKDMMYDLEEKYIKYEQRNTLEKKKNSRNTKGETLLHEAARDGDLDKVKQLLQCGYDVNAKDYGGWTPLSEAVNHGHLDVSRVLLQNGAEVDCQSGQALLNDDGTACDSAGDTPLMEACANGHIDVAKLLITFKASVSRCNHNGFSALYFLNSYINNHDLDDNQKRECQKLAQEIDEKQRKEGFKESALFPISSSPCTSKGVRCHSPVQIIDDINLPKKLKKRPERRAPSYDRGVAMDDDFGPLPTESAPDEDIHMALNLYGNDETFDHFSTTSSERRRNRNFAIEEGNRSRINTENSSRSSRKRAASPISVSTSSSAKKSATIAHTSSYSRSSRPERVEAIARPTSRKKKKFAFTKRTFDIINPLTNQPVTMRRCFADDGVDMDEVINLVDQIFVRYNE
ncbi:unnamed protein product [Bursaphelenchus xylophilus]|uniref:(pine wood nematode) hypothetical protein n=1 Tax=Bursaphelenchus xylophilus TaxID=6326 RepID=A0A1I7RSE6_BURXY|nr:unnamed protein product [Bursaphelenchus xylophilus]CAG9123008.1 unnamed protein product [Bursaphelenchus xylophilus]